VPDTLSTNLATDAARGDAAPVDHAPAAPSTRRERRTVRGRIRGHLGYQPALDGVRAFAVLAVMLYHAGQSWAIGGYLGVDVFFVLSGFLITSLLVQEWCEVGRIDLRAFWVRRAKRLLPALGVVMLGIITYAAVFAAPGEVDTIRSDAFASLGYVANWRFILSGQSYFAQFTQPSPLKHMWSLAIEEQFYLFWPLVVVGVLAVWKSVRAVVVLSVAMIIGSALLMAVLYHPHQDPSRVYYGTDTRVQSLLVGAVAGVLLLIHGPIRSRGALLGLRCAAALGALYVVWECWRMSERTDNLYRGGFLLSALAVVAVVASVTQPHRGALGAFLSLPPLRFIGRISYGLYLWHWPVYLTLTATRTGVSGTALLLLRLAVTTAFAVASFVLIERPVRSGRLRVPRPAVLIPLAFAMLVAGVVLSTTGGEESFAVQTEKAMAAAHRAPPRVPPAQAGSAAPVKALMVGDSVAFTLGRGFEHVDNSGVVLWDRSQLGCGFLPADQVKMGGQVVDNASACIARLDYWMPSIDQFQPDVVIMLVGAWDILDRKIDGQWYRPGTVEYDQLFLSELDRDTAALTAGGRKLVVLTTPFFSRPELLTTGQDWSEYDPWRVDRINALYRDFLVDHPGRFTLIDLNKKISPHGRFADSIDGIPVRGDGVHFTQEGAAWVDEWLAPQIVEVAHGIAPPATEGPKHDARGTRAE
jgi:peptidoglycan/LPS O-acetylase OafA/YrhL